METNQKPNALSEKIERQRMQLCAGWMNKFGIAFAQEVSEERILLYTEALLDLPDESLENAFRECMQICKFFPTLAEIREQTRKQFDACDQFNAEKAWGDFKKLFKNHWHPDVGFHGKYPRLDDAGEHAMQLIGGCERFAATPLEHENFVRKEFIAAYCRYRETGAYLAPTREQAAALLGRLKEELPE